MMQGLYFVAQIIPPPSIHAVFWSTSSDTMLPRWRVTRALYFNVAETTKKVPYAEEVKTDNYGVNVTRG